MDNFYLVVFCKSFAGKMGLPQQFAVQFDCDAPLRKREVP